MEMEERVTRLEALTNELDTHLTAITYINRAMLPLIRADRATASQLLTIAFDAMEEEMAAPGWTEEWRDSARQQFDQLATFFLDTCTPAGHSSNTG